MLLELGSGNHISGILDGSQQHHLGIGDLAVGESQGHAVHRVDDAGFDLGIATVGDTGFLS